MSNSADTELLNIFWVEVSDYLQTLNNGLLQIETRTASDRTSVLREMNRVAHSMKGAARAVGINVIETIAHYMEEIFGSALSGKLHLTPSICDLMYDGMDLIQNVVNGMENSTEALAAVLARLEQTIVAPEAPKATQEVAVHPPDPLPAPSSDGKSAGKKHTTTMRAVTGSMELSETGTLLLRPAEDGIRVPVSKLDQINGGISELLVSKMHGEERHRDILRLQKLNHRWQRDWRSVRTAYIRLARRLQTRSDENAADLAALFKFLETNQRYLVEANRQLAQLSREMAQYNSQLGTLIEQIQEDVGRMRLVPFESGLAGFQRMVRDLARDTDKNIFLDIAGAAVELDKTTLDALKEPIMHLLRNAIDHGIEPAAEREKLGKPATGRIHLSVEQRGKEIVVRLGDDGRGLDAVKIGRAAFDAGLVTAQELAGLSEEEVYNFIFHPGLSTNEQVTKLSGRGMGMDIVRTRVESLRGRVSVQSALGKGATFSLSVPLSLTRMSCILLRVGDQNFAVPSTRVSRMLTINRDQIFTAEGHDMVQIQDQPMTLIPLHALLGIAPGETTDEEITLLVLTAGERSIAFEVDALFSEQELVLKPLGREIEQARYISGVALLGTGDVLIVLDANDLIRGATGSSLPSARRTFSEDGAKPDNSHDRLRVLVVDDSITTRTLEKHILETAGFDVSVAIDGAEAWNMLGELVFDVVIADVEMPNMNGLELTRRIKETGHTQYLPVILLTSLAKPEQREAGLKAGADAYLVKSQFDQSELLRVIQAVL